MDKEKLKYEIMALDFALADLKLYLDTHPDCTESIKLFNSIVDKRKVMFDTYQSLYGPLYLPPTLTELQRKKCKKTSKR